MRDRRVRLWIWLSVIGIGIFVYFCQHPIRIKQEAKISQGVAMTLDSTSDYLVVVDEMAPNATPESFMEMSFSYAWINTFQQEIGPVSVIGAQQFPQADLSGFKLVVLTRSVSERGDWVPKIRSYLERGGNVVLEMPGAKLRALASADGKGGLRKPQTVTYAHGLMPEFQKALSAIKLSEMTQIIGSAGPLDDSQTWMTIDGVPVIYTKHYSAGNVITVDFDYGMLLTSLQQGRPLDDLTIRNMRGTAQIETEDLAKLDVPDMPIADILERFIVYGVVGHSVAIASFWPFFDSMNGAIVVTHDEGGMGDAALWTSQYEATFQASSTLFARVPLQMTEYGVGLTDKTHTELGLSFELNADDKSSAQEPMGWFKFSPIWRTYNVDQQTQQLRQWMPTGSQLISSQAKDGIWTSLSHDCGGRVPKRCLVSCAKRRSWLCLRIGFPIRSARRQRAHLQHPRISGRILIATDARGKGVFRSHRRGERKADARSHHRELFTATLYDASRLRNLRDMARSISDSE